MKRYIAFNEFLFMKLKQQCS